MPVLYVLQCEDNRYYIGKTDRPIENRIYEHFNNYGSEWTKKFKPFKVIEVRYDADEFDEDKYTKIYMKKYGIDNVRGGTYTQLELCDYQRKTLEKELCSASDLCFRCNRSGHFANQCYAKTKADGTLLYKASSAENEVQPPKVTDIKENPNCSPKQMRQFINQKFRETKQRYYNLTSYRNIFDEMCKSWQDNYPVRKPLYPDFLEGCRAVWNSNLNCILINKDGIDYCFPKPYKTLDGGIVSKSQNEDLMEIKNTFTGGNSQAFLHYVVPLNKTEEAQPKATDKSDIANLVNEGMSLISLFFSTITVYKTVKEGGNTKLEMNAVSITKIRESNKTKIQFSDQVYNIINTKRDMGLFAGSKNNYIIIEGTHEIVPNTYKLIMH